VEGCKLNIRQVRGRKPHKVAAGAHRPTDFATTQGLAAKGVETPTSGTTPWSGRGHGEQLASSLIVFFNLANVKV